MLKTGPFAWSGALSYYIPYFCWLCWFSTASIYMIKEVRRRMVGADRPAAVCRELTKTYEQVLRGSLAELAQWAADVEVRGEITVVLAGAVARDAPMDVLVERVRGRVADGERLKDAVHAVAAGSSVSKRDLYAAALPADA